MKKIFVLLTFVIFTSSLFSQVKFVEKQSDKKEVRTHSYDSLRNYPQQSTPEELVGQTIIIGKPRVGEGEFYSKFENIINRDEYKIPAEKLTGETLKIIGYHERDYYNSYYELLYGEKSIYYRISPTSSVRGYDRYFDWPFIIEGYYKKMNEKLKGEKFVIQMVYVPDKDFYTGKEVNRVGGTWEFVELVVDKKDFDIFAIFKNTNNDMVGILPQYIYDHNGKLTRSFFTEKEAANHKKRFGSKVWNAILKKDVLLGMNADACVLSIGRPDDINRTKTRYSVNEQWVYESGYYNYIYFENGIVNAIQ